MKCEIGSCNSKCSSTLCTPFCVSKEIIFISTPKTEWKQRLPQYIGQWHLICLLMAFFFHTHRLISYFWRQENVFWIILQMQELFIITGTRKSICGNAKMDKIETKYHKKRLWFSMEPITYNIVKCLMSFYCLLSRR